MRHSNDRPQIKLAEQFKQMPKIYAIMVTWAGLEIIRLRIYDTAHSPLLNLKGDTCRQILAIETFLVNSTLNIGSLPLSIKSVGDPEEKGVTVLLHPEA